MPEKKDMILTVSPNEYDIPEAVNTWKKREYEVTTYTISDLRFIEREYLAFLHRYETVRPFFAESGWGNIPSRDQIELLPKILEDSVTKWTHFAKKNPPSDKKDLLLVFPKHDRDIRMAKNVWEQREYAVHPYPLIASANAINRIIANVRDFESVRLLFFESAWRKMKPWAYYELLQRSYIEPTVYWVHFAKV